MAKIVKIIGIVILFLVAIFILLVIVGFLTENNFDYDTYNKLSQQITKDIFSLEPLWDANQFTEARNIILDAKLKLSEAESMLASQNSPEFEDLKKDLSASKYFLSAFEDFTDVKEMEQNKDLFVLSVYNKLIKKMESRHNKLAQAYNIALDINNPEIISEDQLKTYKNIIDQSEIELQEFTKEEVLNGVFVNTYISKIDTEAVRDLAIKLIKNNCFDLFGHDCETDSERAQVLYNFVRDNHTWVGDPSSFDVREADYIQTPEVTLNRGAGDCDDQAVLLNSLFESVGVPSAFCFGNTEGKEPFSINYSDHGFSAVNINNQFIFADSVCKQSELGETCFPKIEKSQRCFPISEFKRKISEANNK